MPSELFYTINAIIPIVLSVTGLISGFIMILIVIKNRKFHTVHNLLKCEMSFTSGVYFVLVLISCSYTLRNDWESHQPLCQLRAYLLTGIVGAVSYSFLIQAISQLFFSYFFMYPFLLTWRTHWILIILKWIVSFLLMAEPLFIEGGYELIREYRTCSVSISILSVAVYSIVFNFFLPASIVSTIFLLILKRVHQSMRQVRPIIQMNSLFAAYNQPLPSSRKHLKVMQQMMTLMNIYGLGGVPYTLMILWNSIKINSLPVEFIFISTNLIVCGATVMTIVTLLKDRQMRKVLLETICLQ